MKAYDIDSKTVVDQVYSITNRADFDSYIFENKDSGNFIQSQIARFSFYRTFLKSHDIFITNFDGGILRGTKLRFKEHLLWQAARKKVIVWPYGADSYVYSTMLDHTFRYGLTKSYPKTAKNDPTTYAGILYFSKYADFIVGNIPHNESCPKSDILTVACYGVDTNEWTTGGKFAHTNDGSVLKPVRILHAPNHPAVKGTNFIVEAVRELQEEGFTIEFDIVQGVKNEELRDRMKECDIVAAQLLYGYASTEIEGMSLEKPVISNLENDGYYAAARRYTYFKNCPLVSATPETLKKKLRELITNPELRQQIGKQGREYVLQYHSLAGQGKMWSAIVNKVWNGSNDDIDDWWK